MQQESSLFSFLTYMVMGRGLAFAFFLLTGLPEPTRMKDRSRGSASLFLSPEGMWGALGKEKKL